MDTLITSLLFIGALVAVYFAVQKVRTSRARKKSRLGGPGSGGGGGGSDRPMR